MKKELRRIEATLAQLADQPHSEPAEPGSMSVAMALSALAPIVPSMPALSAPSFDTQRSTSLPLPYRPTSMAESVYTDASKMPPSLKPNQPTGLSAAKIPRLPTLQASDPINHLSATKPAAVDVLNAIAAVADSWQNELQQLLHQIQALYAEGPLVDGWLEPSTPPDRAGQTVRRAEPSYLLSSANDSDEFRQTSDRTQTMPHPTATLDETTASYRLCGFNEDGQLWFRHCPMEQVAAVRLAIARYERLKQTLARKQFLVAQLDQLAEALVVIHKSMPDSREHYSIA